MNRLSTSPFVWPAAAKFGFSQIVQRCNSRSGKPPTYRFRGRICGWYVGADGALGYAVNSSNEPGCIQIYPESGLEAT